MGTTTEVTSRKEQFVETVASYLTRLGTESSELVKTVMFATENKNDKYLMRNLVRDLRRHVEKMNMYIGYIEEINEGNIGGKT